MERQWWKSLCKADFKKTKTKLITLLPALMIKGNCQLKQLAVNGTEKSITLSLSTKHNTEGEVMKDNKKTGIRMKQHTEVHKDLGAKQTFHLIIGLPTAWRKRVYVFSFYLFTRWCYLPLTMRSLNYTFLHIKPLLNGPDIFLPAYQNPNITQSGKATKKTLGM